MTAQVVQYFTVGNYGFEIKPIQQIELPVRVYVRSALKNLIKICMAVHVQHKTVFQVITNSTIIPICSSVRPPTRHWCDNYCKVR